MKMQKEKLVKNSSRLIRCLCFVGLLLGARLSFGQVVTGTPPFSSLGGGPFDTLDLGNLNVHFAIPVVNKAGRGIPFNYALSYDSSIWTPVTGGGSTYWTPVANWGWRATTESLAGYVSKKLHFNIQCGSWWTFTYHDPSGTPHDFPLYPAIDPNQNCGTLKGSGVAPDGSGYGIYVDASGAPWTATVFPPSGGSIYFPDLNSSQTGAATITDPNGNYIQTTDGLKFTDTTDQSGTTELTISSGSNWTKYTYTAPSGASAVYEVDYQSYPVETHFNCSGITDFGLQNISLVSSITLPDNSQYTFTYEKSDSTPHYSGRIASVTLPTGGKISYAYTGSNNGIECADGSAAGLNRTTPDSSTAWTYVRSGTIPSTTTTVTSPPDPNTGNKNQTVINFYNGYETLRKVYSGSSSIQQTVQTCYNTSCSTNPYAPITQLNVYRSVDGTNGTNSSQTQVTYNSTSGLPTDTQQLFWNTNNWSKLSDQATSYTSYQNPFDPSNTIKFYRPSTVTAYDGSSNMKAKTAYAYDQNALQTTTSPNHNTTFSGSRGNVTTITRYVTSSATLSQQFWYNDTGTPYKIEDANQAFTYYYYTSCGNSFLTSVTLPVNSMSRSMTWNCTGGVMTSFTDENSQEVKINYTKDAYFWRPESAQDQLQNVTNFTYSSLTQTESYMNFNGQISTVDVLTTLDGLGRPYLTQRKQGQSSSFYDSVEQQYDALGRPYWTSVPYAAGAGGSAPSGTPENITYYDGAGRPIKTTYGYTTSSSGPIVNVSYPNLNDVYQSLAPAPSGEKTKDRQMEYDAVGRLTSVCEVTSTLSGNGTCYQISSSTGYWTKYAYDSPINSMKVTQSAQGGTAQTRTYQYDMLGRLTSETNPESGTTQYYWDTGNSACGAYTSNGDLMAKSDNAGVSICYGYDAMHRLLGFGPTNSTNCTGYVYDAPPAGVNPPSGSNLQNTAGRLIEAYTNNQCNGHSSIVTDEWFGYSARGEVTDIYMETPNSNGYYHINKTYWANGALKILSDLPGVPTIYYGASDGSGLDGEGRATQVTASSGLSPATEIDYNNSSLPIGAMTKLVYGSGAFDTYAYDTKTGSMNGYAFYVGSSGQAVMGTLTWNQNGTLQTQNIVDPFNSGNQQNCTYAYDDLARVNSVNCVNGSTNVWNQNFTLDAFGNIAKTVPSGGTGTSFQASYVQPNGSINNQIYSLPGFNPTYDADGELTNDSFHQYQWDAQGHMTSVDLNSQLSVQTYDAFGHMVEQNWNNGGWIGQFLYDENGYRFGFSHPGVVGWTYVPLPGGGQVAYTGGTPANYDVHPDWQGSGRFSSTQSQLGTPPVSDMAFAPYGERYAITGQASHALFGGIHEELTLDLFDATFREYHPTQGRWISPDPAGLGAVDMTNPQTWNRYAYVMNNPLSYVDPTGQYCMLWFREDHLHPCSQGSFANFFEQLFFLGAWGYNDPSDDNRWVQSDLPPGSLTNGGLAANNGPVVLKNPCQVQGRALPPGAYATQGQQANGSTVNFALDVAMGFPAGHYLDPQPLASGNVFQRQAYGNYTFGVYMAAAGVSLNTALSGANTYAFFFSSYSKSTPMDPNQGSLPAASVTNITNGYNAYANGTVCHN